MTEGIGGGGRGAWEDEDSATTDALRVAATLPSVELIGRIAKHAVANGGTPRGIAEMAARWGYMHGQWEGRADLVGVESPASVWANDAMTGCADDQIWADVPVEALRAALAGEAGTAATVKQGAVHEHATAKPERPNPTPILPKKERPL